MYDSELEQLDAKQLPNIWELFSWPDALPMGRGLEEGKQLFYSFGYCRV